MARAILDLGDDKKCLQTAVDLIQRVKPSTHSVFVSACVITFEQENGTVAAVTGVNCELHTLAGSLCAEQVAAAKLREIPDIKRVRRIYVVCEGKDYIPPGLQSREMLYEFARGSTPIIMAGTGNVDNPTCTTLVMLYPFPPLFRKTLHTEIAASIEVFSKTAQQISCVPGFKENQNWVDLYTAVKAATQNDKSEVYPVKLAAGVLFSDNSTKIVSQSKAVEFASSIDPVVKLIPFLEEKVAEGVTPSLVLMSDQFGVLHAPFACARAFLAEHGYEDLKLIVHNRQGCLQKTTIAHLSPQLKRIKEFRMGVAVVEEQRTKPLRKKKSDKKRTKSTHRKSSSIPPSPTTSPRKRRSGAKHGKDKKETKKEAVGASAPPNKHLTSDKVCSSEPLMVSSNAPIDLNSSAHF